jgi:hypothetical protein
MGTLLNFETKRLSFGSNYSRIFARNVFAKNFLGELQQADHVSIRFEIDCHSPKAVLLKSQSARLTHRRVDYFALKEIHLKG